MKVTQNRRYNSYDLSTCTYRNWPVSRRWQDWQVIGIYLVLVSVGTVLPLADKLLLSLRELEVAVFTFSTRMSWKVNSLLADWSNMH